MVTEPAKSVRALKWAVEEMERRYRMMSSVNSRNIGAFNEKVRTAAAKGKPLGRRVQTGFDPDTGEELYEEEQLDYQPLPQIVLIVDELADLMVTVGKEIEVLIQRLSQKSRAAGIHLIMATQRPSVDVITGVIKANLPTRISFKVTSRIDSRTILGEQGAEQLLGKGDMLYKPNTGATLRVHGPFVSDEEVEAVADHWRAQGKPDYVDAVTEEPEDGGGFGFEDDMTASDDPDRAQISAGLPGRVRKPEGIGQLAPAPDGRRLQHRGQVDRADGRRRPGRPGQPCRPPRYLPRQGRQSALTTGGMKTAPDACINRSAPPRPKTVSDPLQTVWTSLKDWWADHVMTDVDHGAVLQKIAGESSMTPRYIFMTCMSAGIAILGMLLSSPAVVIGAMLLSPLDGTHPWAQASRWQRASSPGSGCAGGRSCSGPCLQWCSAPSSCSSRRCRM